MFSSVFNVSILSQLVLVYDLDSPFKIEGVIGFLRDHCYYLSNEGLISTQSQSFQCFFHGYLETSFSCCILSCDEYVKYTRTLW